MFGFAPPASVVPKLGVATAGRGEDDAARGAFVPPEHAVAPNAQASANAHERRHLPAAIAARYVRLHAL